MTEPPDLMAALEASLADVRLPPETGTENLRPCLIEMGEHTLSMLARDYEAAVIALERLCLESDIERRSAVFTWDDEALARGWVRP